MHGAFEGALPDGWQGGLPTTKYWNGEYIKLYRVTRLCASCAAEISIDVTKKALQGFSKNAGLLLRNCPTCRAARKAGGPGSRGGTSRPVAASAPGQPAAAPATASNAEIEELRRELAEAKKELSEYGQTIMDTMAANQALRKEVDPLKAEIHALKLRLAPYDLQTSMEAAKNNSKIFPWGVDSP